VTKRMESFEGDVAVKVLRERMALARDLPLEPPMRDDGRPALGMVGRLVGFVTMASIAACGFVWTSTLQLANSGFALATYEKPVAPALNNISFNAASSNNGSFSPAVFQSPPVPAAGLKVDLMQPSDEAPPVDRLQVLAPVPWPTPDGGRDLANTPRDTETSDFAVRSVVPAPAVTASLLPSPEAESQMPLVSTAPRINDEEMTDRLASGRYFLIIGDVVAARLAFRRAAESGNAQAALALAGTFDPLVLKSLGAVGVVSDPATARRWYQKAAELGSPDAPQRLSELAQSAR
jgi:hypothetical protein